MATPKTPKQIDIKVKSLRRQISQLLDKRKKAVVAGKKKAPVKKKAVKKAVKKTTKKAAKKKTKKK